MGYKVINNMLRANNIIIAFLSLYFVASLGFNIWVIVASDSVLTGIMLYITPMISLLLSLVAVLQNKLTLKKIAYGCHVIIMSGYIVISILTLHEESKTMDKDFKLVAVGGFCIWVLFTTISFLSFYKHIKILQCEQGNNKLNLV